MMFNLMKRKVKRSQVPRGGLWFFDNYEKISQRVPPELVSEAAFNKNKRELVRYLYDSKNIKLISTL